jgi:TonB family protein
MRVTGLSPLSAFAALLLLAPVAQAQVESPERPAAEVMLPCDGACPTIVPAIVLSRHRPVFPQAVMRQGSVTEAHVKLRFIVGVDGRVRDMQVVELLGPQEFARSARLAAQQWTFAPATMGGRPVASPRELNYLFLLNDRRAGARREIVDAYGEAFDLIKEGKLDEAEAGLAKASGMPRLTFYERAMMANLRSSIALQKNEYEKARAILRIAASYAGSAVPDIVKRSLWRNRIMAALNLGDLGDAVSSLARFKEQPGFDPADPVAQLVVETRQRIEDVPAVSTSGVIPEAEDGEGFSFLLFRRKFSFANI